MNYYGPLTFSQTKIKFPKIVTDINNILLRFNNKIKLPSLQGMVYGIHTTEDDKLHNPTDASVGFECRYKLENDDTIYNISINLWYNNGKLNRKDGTSAVIIYGICKLHEELGE
jgi:hypothetical protein